MNFSCFVVVDVIIKYAFAIALIFYLCIFAIIGHWSPEYLFSYRACVETNLHN